MSHTVYIDRGDYYDVIADYSLSPRHAALSEAEWKSEYANDSAYADMRASQAGSVAGITPKGAGKWKKDWSGPYVDPCVSLILSADGIPDYDGVPTVSVGGSQTITIQKVDQDGNPVNSGTEEIRIHLSSMVPVQSTTVNLVAGQATVDIGPCSNPCDITIRAVDPAGVLRTGTIKIRFD